MSQHDCKWCGRTFEHSAWSLEDVTTGIISGSPKYCSKKCESEAKSSKKKGSWFNF